MSGPGCKCVACALNEALALRGVDLKAEFKAPPAVLAIIHKGVEALLHGDEAQRAPYALHPQAAPGAITVMATLLMSEGHPLGPILARVASSFVVGRMAFDGHPAVEGAGLRIVAADGDLMAAAENVQQRVDAAGAVARAELERLAGIPPSAGPSA